jgi:signal transduction histidine kinase
LSVAVFLIVAVLGACHHGKSEHVATPQLTQAEQPKVPLAEPPVYERQETSDLVSLVNHAAALVQKRGDGAFADFRVPGSRWRRGETYVFVLDPKGNMLVHPDPTMEGKNEMNLQDVDGKPIIRGLIGAATAVPGKTDGWYHYQWPVPDGILPRWKSSYVRLVTAPGGRQLVVGSGIYDDRMEKPFVVDLVKDAVGRIEKDGQAALPILRDKAGPFIVKDTYVFVLDSNGTELVNPGSPYFEGRNVLDWKDANGKRLNRDMIDLVAAQGSGWIDYMWPKPGEAAATQKSSYVSRARLGNRWVVVGCGVYLPNAPKQAPVAQQMKAPELMSLVREGAQLVAARGDDAFPELRKKGTKWFHDDTYFTVTTLDGMRVLNAVNPSLENTSIADAKDVRGRPYGKELLAIGRAPSGEGWVHYVYPSPDNVFPAWKSVFVKRVASPSGKPYLVASGVYDMQMDDAFIADVVHRAADLVAQQGTEAFPAFRDKTGPFYFMDTYVFVDRPDGVEVVNAAYPMLEGRTMLGLKDARGKEAAREYIDAAMKNGSGWVEYEWYRPGHGTPVHKRAFVQKVTRGGETYVVGSGYFVER